MPNIYHNSLTKKLFNFFMGIVGLLIFFPILILISFCIWVIDHKPIFYKQQRVGYNGQLFTLIKFRTMVTNAEKLQNKYKHLNISDFPTFKIPNDPRYARFGKYLVKTGLDELPQLINVLKGEMSLVGPRPLPVYEANKLANKDKVRELVLPGITSSWVIKGGHRMKFKEWMKLDREYVEKATLITDIYILASTTFLIGKLTLRKVISFFTKFESL